MSRKNTEQDIWGKIDRSAGPDACWPWLKYTQPSHKDTVLKIVHGKIWAHLPFKKPKSRRLTGAGDKSE